MPNTSEAKAYTFAELREVLGLPQLSKSSDFVGRITTPNGRVILTPLVSFRTTKAGYEVIVFEGVSLEGVPAFASFRLAQEGGDQNG